MGSNAPRRRTTGFCLACLLVLVLAVPTVFAVSPPNVWPAVLAVANLDLPVASGVQYRHTTLATADGPLEVHQMQVDLSNPTVRLGVGLARDRLMSDDEPVSSMVLRAGAIAGVNADYFDIHQSGIPLNILLQNGQLLRSPWRWVALVVGRDGAARIVRYRWTGTLMLPETGETRPLDGYNTGLVPNGIVLMSNIRGYGAPPPDPGARQMVVELTPTDETGRSFVKQVWPQRAFFAPFPNNDLILVGLGAGADWLGRLNAGSPVQLNLTTDPDWRDAQLAIGGGPVLVQNGQVVEDPDAPSPKERDYRYPVIAVGIGQDGHTLTFVEVDGRQPALSIGLTRPQLAEYMRRIGAAQAMAFDSGGSATMVVRLPGAPAPAVVNSPSDGTERPVADAVLVYSSAVPGAPARLLVNGGRPLDLFAGTTAALSLIGVDAQGNPTALTDPIEATTSPANLITVGADANGAVTAG
ncbi:MAG TPA: phosphodiester glycosidase family protein, partial [bacterium]|nr:phosphodiester glycosidase family protein [bacterium]